jgi:hypothetical protein
LKDDGAGTSPSLSDTPGLLRSVTFFALIRLSEVGKIVASADTGRNSGKNTIASRRAIDDAFPIPIAKRYAALVTVCDLFALIRLSESWKKWQAQTLDAFP